MSPWKQSWKVAGLLAVALSFVAPLANAAETKTERTNGRLVSADADAKTIVVREKGKEQTYGVTPEGSVLTRTTVTMNGKATPFAELKPGMLVILYWKPDPADAGKRYARKIDVPRIPPEFQADVDAAESEESGSQ